jgi:acetyl-CoA carboxylase carboxyltransferase component
VVECPQALRPKLLQWFRRSDDEDMRSAVLEAALRRYYRIRDLEDVHVEPGPIPLAVAEYVHEGARFHVVTLYAPAGAQADVVRRVEEHMVALRDVDSVVVDANLWQAGPLGSMDERAAEVSSAFGAVAAGSILHRVDVTVTSDADGATQHVCLRRDNAGFYEDVLYRNLHPMLAKRLEIGTFSNFRIERLPTSAEDVYLFQGVALDNERDERLFAVAEVRDLQRVHDEDGRVVGLPMLERIALEALAAIRHVQSHRPPPRRFLENRLILFVRPLWDVPVEDWRPLAARMAGATRGLGLEKVVVRVRIPEPSTGREVEAALDIHNPEGRGVVVERRDGPMRPLQSLSPYRQKVLQAQRRGNPYPFELVKLLTPAPGVVSDFPPGSFTEYDLDGDGALVPAGRPFGQNTANLVVGVLTSVTPTYPEGMTRVAILGDPTRGLGNLAEPECRRIIAALDLAARLRVPAEWYALSSGALIAMDSGTENMDWISAVLRQIIEFTQAGGELNIVVTGINVGAQPYWNAEATMLMHTKGVLIMTPESAMVLTGKYALDYSGGVSAEDNFGIGGFERVMGQNGQGQYWAPDLQTACLLLLRHYDLTYVAPGERFPRRAPTDDPSDRDVCASPHAAVEGADFVTVGDVFSAERNPDRKKPFDIRSVMRAAVDQDHEPLERWHRMAGAETGVVWDAHLGGIPVCVLGIESHTQRREGFVPADGPEVWSSGTLYPLSSKKLARAINAASGNRPLVVLANLSGFDGSPESMRSLQLEYGAEIGRAIVNFEGPIVFVVVSRYHGGAFVVFSKRLNEHMEIAAVEGSFASVIGGAPAAAVVFSREVDSRTKPDERVQALDQQIAAAPDADQQHLRARRDDLWQHVRSEKLGEVADEFANVHTIQRALRVGSVDRIIPASELRPYLIAALERGIERYSASASGGAAPSATAVSTKAR